MKTTRASRRIETEVSTPVEVARQLWGLAGAPPGLIGAGTGPVPPELQPWGDYALEAFESLVATLGSAKERLAIRQLLTSLGSAGFDRCAPEILAGAPEAYLALAHVRGLAETLTNTDAVQAILMSGLLSVAQGPAGAEAESCQPGLPLVYEMMALS